jgi:sugar O-acyltransferase (sialic acid O-acetyltransferase NeuD family)
MSDYILIGCGGFALEVAEYLKDRNLQLSATERSALVSDVVSTSHSRFDDLCSILGYSPKFHETPDTVQKRPEKKVLICLGSPEARHRNFVELKHLGFIFGTLVHDTAWVAESAQIDEGVIVCPFAFIGAMAKVEANSVVNTRATVGHDVTVGVSAVLSPHCDLNGASACGRVSFVGAGAILDPSTAIGDYTKVSSGAVVKQKFGDGFLLAGSPAKGRQMFKVGNADKE